MAGDEDGTGADLVEGGERTPRESSSSSSDIPAQDIKKEEDTRRADNGLSEAWHKYKQFESYSYVDKSVTITDFISEWESRLSCALAAGCDYSDAVLAFKLLDNSHLNCDEIHQVLSSVSSQPGLVNSNLLMQIKTFLVFYHHAEVKKKMVPEICRPDSVEKFVYTSEQVFKEELGTETIPEHSSTRSLKLARRKRTKLKKSARTSQLKEADSVSVASTSNGEQIPVYSEHKSEDEDERLGDDADNDDDNDELEYQKIKQKTDHSSRSDVKIGIVRGKKTYNREYTCTFCKKLFYHPEHLKRHVRTHTGEKPYECDVCLKSFSRNDGLVKHKRIHTGEKPYQCTVCAKTFTENTALTKHQRIHTAEKPFMCDVCSKAFSHKHNLLDHQRLHLGLKPYLCDICCKAFNHKAKMVNHMRTHTGEKPFQCEVCPKTFASKFGMTKHQKVHKTREAKIAPVAGSSLGPLMYDSLIVKDRREQDFYPKLKTESFGSYRNAGIS